MEVTLKLPDDLEELAIEGLRSGKLTIPQVRRLLGIGSRYEMDGFLQAHELFLEATVEDIARDAETALTFMK